LTVIMESYPDGAAARGPGRHSGAGVRERELMDQVSQDHAKDGQDHRGHPEQGGGRG
jgi:hypothetical protein